MGGVVQITKPSEDVVSLEDVKNFLRIDFNDDDLFLISQIKMATNAAEKYLNSALVTRTLELSLDRLPEYEQNLREGLWTGPYMSFVKEYIDLPFSPVVSVTSIKTFNDNDDETTVPQSYYILDNYRKPARVVLRNGQTWPDATREVNSLIIRYEAGYGNASVVPEPIRLAILQMISYMYEHRGDQVNGQAPDMQQSTEALLQPYRIMSFSVSKLGV